MAPLYEAHSASARLGRLLLTVFIIGIAVILGGGALFTAAVKANAVPPFYVRLPLAHGQTLDIGFRAGCPEAMPETACRRVARRFPRTFKVIYWSGGEKYTLVSIAQPRR